MSTEHNIYIFNEGPFDGATASVRNGAFVGDIIFCLPCRLPGDSDDVWTGIVKHRYTAVSSTQVDGSDTATNQLHHVSAIVKNAEQFEREECDD